MNFLDFFRFKEEPFRLTPDRDFYFPSSGQRSIAAVIGYGLEQGEGFIVVTGEVGTGKTMLLRYLTTQLFNNYETAMLLSPQLSPKELVLAILRDVGHEVDGGASLDLLLHSLNDHLFTLAKAGKKLVVIIDEAQGLPTESIEQLRLLSNFETDKHKWLQIILVGQPELADKISHPGLRQLKQRITITETLHPLSAGEAGEYIHFRLSTAGRRNLRLDKKLNRLISRYTGGVPRLINKLLSRTLLVMYSDKKHSFDKKSIQTAAQSLGMIPERQRTFFPMLSYSTGGMLFFFLIMMLI